MADEWQYALRRDGSQAGRTVHLPSPFVDRRLCKRAMRTWELRHKPYRLRACRAWLQQHRYALKSSTTSLRAKLRGGAKPFNNIEGMLITYTLQGQKVDGQETWVVTDRSISAQSSSRTEKVDANALLQETAQPLGRGAERGTTSSDPPLLLKQTQFKCRGGGGGDEPQMYANVNSGPQTRTITVLWVRHCFGCHNLKVNPAKGFMPWDALAYRSKAFTSMCVTNDGHYHKLQKRAQALWTAVTTQIRTPIRTQSTPPPKINFKFYASIIPRAMMTAQLIAKKFEQESQQKKDTPAAATSVDEADIRRMWYASEKWNPVEKSFLKRLGAYLLYLVQYIVVGCWSPYQTHMSAMNDRIGNKGSRIKFNDGLNKVSLQASTKYVRYLNAKLPSFKHISMDSPLGKPNKAQYDKPDLMQWEKHVLCGELAKTTTSPDSTDVHVIVTHGKTMEAYLESLQKAASQSDLATTPLLRNALPRRK